MVNAETIGPANHRYKVRDEGMRIAIDMQVEMMERMRVGWSKSNRVLSHSFDDMGCDRTLCKPGVFFDSLYRGPGGEGRRTVGVLHTAFMLLRPVRRN